jgi:hypothetical protein
MKPMQRHSERDDQRFGQTPIGVPKPLEVAGKPLKCVWSGHPHYERDCRSRIPASIVVKAWHREIQLKGTVEGFFNFSWRNGVWLAYGLREGGVRGVYCPTHCHQRDSRESHDAESAPVESQRVQPVVAPAAIGDGGRDVAPAPAHDAPVAWPAYAVGRSSR